MGNVIDENCVFHRHYTEKFLVFPQNSFAVDYKYIQPYISHIVRCFLFSLMILNFIFKLFSHNRIYNYTFLTELKLIVKASIKLAQYLRLNVLAGCLMVLTAVLYRFVYFSWCCDLNDLFEWFISIVKNMRSIKRSNISIPKTF